MTKDILNYFRDAFFQKYEANYPVSWGKDMTTIKRLLEYYTPEAVKKLIDGYFILDDEFVIKHGHPLGVFPGKIPAIMAMQRKNETAKLPDNPDAKLIEKAKKVTGEDSGDF